MKSLRHPFKLFSDLAKPVRFPRHMTFKFPLCIKLIFNIWFSQGTETKHCREGNVLVLGNSLEVTFAIGAGALNDGRKWLSASMPALLWSEAAVRNQNRHPQYLLDKGLIGHLGSEKLYARGFWNICIIALLTCWWWGIGSSCSGKS